MIINSNNKKPNNQIIIKINKYYFKMNSKMIIV